MVLVVFFAGIVLLAVFLLAAAGALYKTYKYGTGGNITLALSKAAIRSVLPLLMLAAGFIKGGKDIIREVYVVANNAVVSGSNKKYAPEDTIILIPHCLQFHECMHRITGNPDNCKNCGKCRIGDIIKVTKKYKVSLYIVTGGTAARAIVIKHKPKLILAVACERDLASAISDIARIPVVGIINDRPYGPCFDTMIDVKELERSLQRFIK